MKKNLILITIGIIVAGGLIFGFPKKNNNQPTNHNQGSQMILFYGQGCLHCAKVEEFIKENKVEEKISFEKKEIYYNKDNAKELSEKAKACGLPAAGIGVPLLWYDSKCLVGDVDIINFFKEKINEK